MGDKTITLSMKRIEAIRKVIAEATEKSGLKPTFAETVLALLAQMCEKTKEGIIIEMVGPCTESESSYAA